MTPSSFILVIATIIALAAQVVVWLGLLYHFLLLVASPSRPGRQPTLTTDDYSSFAIAIPAHNEESVLAGTLGTLARLQYPHEQFAVYVVADHCSDQTAAVARAAGAICHERAEGPRGRKAHALSWLIARILASPRRYDAVLVFDADSQVDAGFLSAMNEALRSGAQVLQGQHIIQTSGQGMFEGLASIDMRINNRLRNQAKANLGLSCRLMGDAMCFTSAVLRRFGWPTESLGEDREFGLFLATHGIRVGYCPTAMSYGQAAPSWRSASQQRVRWYGGVQQIRRNLRAALVKAGFAQRDWAMLDGALELTLPSFSMLGLLAILTVALTFLPGLAATWLVVLCWLSLVLWLALPPLCLLADRAPVSAFCALVFSPIYILWRLSMGLAARMGGKRVRWVRTVRREETKRVH